MSFNECFLSRRAKPIVVGFPTSVLDIEPDLRGKTRKIGCIIRFLSIFRVDKAVIYYDKTIPLVRHKEYAKLITKIHKYIITPPYLRKKLIPLERELRFVGIIPPLRLNVFDVKKDQPNIGEYRIGVVVKSDNNTVYVDVGLSRPIPVYCISYCPRPGNVIVVKITSLKPLEGVYSNEFDKKVYVGPMLEEGDLVDTIHYYRSRGYMILGTSRKGQVIDIHVLEEIGNMLKKMDGVYVLFGGPYAGLYEIDDFFNKDIDLLADLVVNTIPCQGTKTVRMEEALIATLSLLNIVLEK